MHTHDQNSEAKRCHSLDHQYGRRVEVDRSWTVYNVFTGVPADAGCGATTGLSPVDATDRMTSLNDTLHRTSQDYVAKATSDRSDGTDSQQQ